MAQITAKDLGIDKAGLKAKGLDQKSLDEKIKKSLLEIKKLKQIRSKLKSLGVELTYSFKIPAY